MDAVDPKYWLVPVMRYEDGAAICRVTTAGGWSDTIIPLWKRESGHWLDIPFRAGHQSPMNMKDHRLFVYLNSKGIAEGSILVDTTLTLPAAFGQKREVRRNLVIDTGGPGLGPITGTARKRLLGFIYGNLLPYDPNPIHQDARLRLPSPEVFYPTTFKRKKTGIRNTFVQTMKNPDRRWSDMVTAARKLMESKSIAPMAWEKLEYSGADDAENGKVYFVGRMRLAVPNYSDDVKTGLVFWPSADWSWFNSMFSGVTPGPVLRRLTERQRRGMAPPMWTLYLFRKDRNQPFEVLGFSDVGPFEAAVDAGLFISKDELEEWLDDNVDFSGEEHPSFKAFDLLDAELPLLWSTEKFLEWAQTSGEW